jgi:hypothetical protein
VSEHLRAVQLAMRAALQDGDAEAFLPFVRRGGRAPEARLETYKGMYWSRLVGSLKDDFPTVRRLLGDALFERVAATHCTRRPSAHPSLGFLGRGFDKTLASLGLAIEADAATLEAARNEAFWAPPVEIVDAGALGALGERLGASTLRMHPSLSHVELARGARALVAGAGLEAVDPREKEVVAVWRSGETICDALVDATESRALASALRGVSVAVVCEAFVDEDAPDSAAIAAILRWVHAGWVCGVTEGK